MNTLNLKVHARSPWSLIHSISYIFLVTRCSVFTLVTETCSFSCPLCSSLWLFFLLLPSFTTSAWKENWSGIKFLPNLLSQTHVLFQKIYSSATFCWLLQLLPLIPLIPSIRSTGGLTCHKVFTGYWILQFISPLANLLLCLLLYLPFFCLLPFFTATATSLSNSLFHPASVESTESTHLV